MASCCLTLVRFSLLVINIIFLVTGVALIVLGTIGLAADSGDELAEHIESLVDARLELPDTTLQALAASLLVLGVIVTLISLLGCCGACLNSRCALFTFAIVLIFVLILEIIVGALAFAYRDELEHFLSDTTGLYRTMIRDYYDDDDSTNWSKNFWDDMQRDLKCCGYNGPQDWRIETGRNVPHSCCTNESEGCTEAKAWQKGCKEAIKEVLRSFLEQLKEHVTTLGISGAVIAAIHLASIVAACWLACAKDSY